MLLEKEKPVAESWKPSVVDGSVLLDLKHLTKLLDEDTGTGEASVRAICDETVRIHRNTMGARPSRELIRSIVVPEFERARDRLNELAGQGSTIASEFAKNVENRIQELLGMANRKPFMEQIRDQQIRASSRGTAGDTLYGLAAAYLKK